MLASLAFSPLALTAEEPRMTFGPLWRRLLDLNRRAPPRIEGAHGPGESAARELFAIWPRARAKWRKPQLVGFVGLRDPIAGRNRRVRRPAL